MVSQSNLLHINVNEMSILINVFFFRLRTIEIKLEEDKDFDYGEWYASLTCLKSMLLKVQI